MMPEYEFDDIRTMQPVCLAMSMADAPEIGSQIPYGNTQLQRVIRTWPRGFAKADTHFTSPSLPTWHPDAPRVNRHGEAQFTSRREVDEFVKKTRDRNSDADYHYDPDGGASYDTGTNRDRTRKGRGPAVDTFLGR